MIRIVCPQCGKVLEIPDSFAGQTGQCVQCKVQILVPIPAPIPAAPPVLQVDVCAQIQAQMDAAEKNSAYRKSLVIVGDEPQAHHKSGDKAKKGCLGCLGVVVILFVAGMIGNMVNPQPSQPTSFYSSRVLERSAQSTTNAPPPVTDTNNTKVALDAVLTSITNPNTWPRPALLTYKTGKLNGGLAIMSSNSGAYWWSPDGKLYAANGIAQAMSPNTPTASVGVSFSEIETVVNGGTIKPRANFTPLDKVEAPRAEPVQSQTRDVASVEDVTVYVGSTGTKYHARNCRTLKTENPISKSQAIARGYTPCTVCGGG